MITGIKICEQAKIEAKVLSHELHSSDLVEGPRRDGNNIQCLSVGYVHWASIVLKRGCRQGTFMMQSLTLRTLEPRQLN